MTDRLDPPVHTVSRGRLLALTLGALALAALIVLGLILPAEFNRDPLGVGGLTGVSRLWAPDQTEIGPNGAGGAPRAQEYAAPYRTDVIEIPLGAFSDGAGLSELEYKVRMKKDAALLYSWEVIGAARPDDLRYDFHGHTLPTATQGMTVATYKQGAALRMHGSLNAPFDGIQGWQFSNGADKPVVVRVRLAGFYELIERLRPGNEAGIIANVPAAQSLERAEE